MQETSRVYRSVNVQARTAISPKSTSSSNSRDYNILKEVLSCCRGLESDVIKYEDPGYVVPTDVFLESSQIINQLLELAYLYRSAKHLISKQQNCMVAEALIEVIQNQLAEYEKKIGNLWSCSKSNYHDSKNTALKRALPWARESMIILQFIVTILNLTQHLSGGAILNPLLKYENHGNKKLSALFKTFLQGASKPLYSMIKFWIFKGVINDPKDEFFIFENKELFGRNRWHYQFILRVELVPNKFNTAQAKLIVETGKCVYFLKQYWSHWSENETYINKMEKMKISFDTLIGEEQHNNYGENVIMSEIRKVHLLNTQYVLKILKEDHNLLNFFSNLHQYILLGQGDIARRFMEAIQLERHKYDRLDVTMDPLLRNILHNMSEGYNKKCDWMNNIHVHINNSLASEETIFEAFSLRYSIQGPLKMIFQAYEKDYHLLFMFLWRKTCMQYKLSLITRELFCLKKYDECTPGFGMITKELYFLKYQMTNFMFHLEYYIVHEVIEKEWYYFLNSFNECKTIDDVVIAHEKMLKRIFMGTLMDNKHKRLNIQIKVIYDLIEEFQNLISSVSSIPNKEEIDELTKFRLKAKISVLSSNYLRSVKCFKRLLTMCHHIDSLSTVYDRIDFNKYYTTA